MKPIIALLLVAVIISVCGGQNMPPIASNLQVHTHKPLSQVTPQSNFNNFHSSMQDRAGNLWFASTDQGVFRFDGTTMTQFTTKEGLCNNTVWKIIEANDGTIWFGTDGGACKYYGGKFTAVTIKKQTNPAPIAVTSLLQDKAGTIWLGTAFNGVYKYDGKSFTPFLDTTIVRNAQIKLNNTQCMVADRQGNIWFGSWQQEGINRYDGKRTLTHFTDEDGINDPMIHYILEDRKGNIWFASRNNGLFCYKDGRFINFTQNTTLKESAICVIAEDKHGHIWLGTDKDGLWRYDGKEFSQYAQQDGPGNNSVFSIIEDKAGNLWFGARNVTLYRYDGKTFTIVIEDGAVL